MFARSVRIMDQWRKIEEIERRYAEANKDYYALAARHSDMTLALLDDCMAFTDADYRKVMSDVVAAKITMTCLFEELGLAQDRYNELAVIRSEPMLIEEDKDDADEFDPDYSDDLDDIDYVPHIRKTRRDIMPLIDAVRAQKVPKNHKLKPRSVKRDRTKTAESKTKTVQKRALQQQ
jgi:hypothetical protein